MKKDASNWKHPFFWSCHSLFNSVRLNYALNGKTEFFTKKSVI